MDAGDPDGNSILFQLLFLAFLTLVNAFFAGAEMAVVSVNKNRIKVLADEGSKRAALLQTLFCLLYTSPSPRDLSTSRMPSSA